MTVQELIAILQTHEPTAVVVTDVGYELRPLEVQAVQLVLQEGKDWGGVTHGAVEWRRDEDGDVKGVQLG